MLGRNQINTLLHCSEAIRQIKLYLKPQSTETLQYILFFLETNHQCEDESRCTLMTATWIYAHTPTRQVVKLLTLYLFLTLSLLLVTLWSKRPTMYVTQELFQIIIQSWYKIKYTVTWETTVDILYWEVFMRTGTRKKDPDQQRDLLHRNL